MDDALLVREFQGSGDSAPFETLVERHRRSVFRLVLSVLGRGREGAAEELTQEVFLKVYRKLDKFRGESKFSSWLYRIAYNQAVSHRSSLRFKTPHYPEEALLRTPSSRPQDDPLALASQAQTAEAVGECLAELPDLYRSVLNLYYWIGMTVPEISETLAAPQGTVKSYLHRARAKLHKLLAEKGITHV